MANQPSGILTRCESFAGFAPEMEGSDMKIQSKGSFRLCVGLGKSLPRNNGKHLPFFQQAAKASQYPPCFQ